MSPPTTDEGAKGSPGMVHGTLGPEGLTSAPTTVWVGGGAKGSPRRVIKLKEPLRGAVSSPYGVYGLPLEPEGLTSAPTTMWVLIIYPTGNNDTR